MAPQQSTAPIAPSNDASRAWMRDAMSSQREVAENSGVLRNVYKRAKNEGEHVEAMRLCIKLRRRDHDEALSFVAALVRYMAISRMPVTQEALFGSADLGVTETTARADDLWDAGEKGYQSGRRGEKIEDCPYPPGAELHVEWARLWAKGQEAIARELGPDAQPADPSRKRPSRGKQTRLPGTEDKQLAPAREARNVRASSKRKKAAGGKRKKAANGARQRDAHPAEASSALN